MNINDIQTDLSKYTLDDVLVSPYKSSSSASSSAAAAADNDRSSTSLSTTGETNDLGEDSDDDDDDMTTLANTSANGLIHGHIHNFNNFTYIHGHIHTNEHQHNNAFDSMNTSLPSGVNEQQRRARRRSSHHRHNNDTHSFEFSDCQHFEFLNCHDQEKTPAILESSNVICNEDENCKPKILEICCDNEHADGTPFMPNVSCDHSHTQEQEDQETQNKEHHRLHHHHHQQSAPDTREILNSLNLTPNTQITEDGNCQISDCIDVKCDLDTCDFDELYCKYCEDLENLPDIKLEQQNNQMFNIPQFTNSSASPSASSSNANISASNMNFLSSDLINSSDTNSSQKRQREDDIHHHLHHQHHHSHPENHHHHHIQLHDHHNLKKQKSDNNSSSLINFEWNFKNQQTKCEWDNCSTLLENSFQLQNHIVENHLLNEYAVPPIINTHNNTSSIGSTIGTEVNSPGAFDCEWKNCDYSGYDLFQLVNHINSTHGFQPIINNDDNMNFKNENGMSFPTPSSDHHNNTSTATSTKKSRRKKSDSDDVEQTICNWVERDSMGNIIHQCSKQFQTAEELTDHLVNDHVGSGKSEYTCFWEGCDRNHRKFNQRQKIIRHLHVHTRYKPFVCKVCHHSFAVETMLEQHMRTHSGEKPYECKICKKHFATSSSLSIHLRTHTGEKPLVCKYPDCGKRFSESSNLTKHMKTHGKTYKCDCCSKSFGKEKQLISHMLKYHSTSSTNESK